VYVLYFTSQDYMHKVLGMHTYTLYHIPSELPFEQLLRLMKVLAGISYVIWYKDSEQIGHTISVWLALGLKSSYSVGTTLVFEVINITCRPSCLSSQCGVCNKSWSKNPSTVILIAVCIAHAVTLIHSRQFSVLSVNKVLINQWVSEHTQG